MKKFWSIKLFSIFGIAIEVHFTFLLLVVFYGSIGYLYEGWVGVLMYVGMILILFTSVLLHELGHSFVAKGYNITVPSIMLLPIGGVAQFQRIPRKPIKELLITIASPAVNFLIFGAIYLFLGWPQEGWLGASLLVTVKGCFYFLMMVNLLMGLFNMLPVFPMDGGRIFRALLAFYFSYLRSTQIAVFTGKFLAVLGIISAIFFYHNWLLAALFAFIYLSADAEYANAKEQEMQMQKLARLGASKDSSNSYELSSIYYFSGVYF